MSSAPYLIPSDTSGTFPVPPDYNLRQMRCSYPESRDDSNMDISERSFPSFPFSDVPIYADTMDIEALSFHDFWGCLLTPDNVAARICTDDLRYHVWVATKRVVESGQIKLDDREALIQAVMNQFMVELGLVLLDLFQGPLVVFVDPRLSYESAQMVTRARALVAKFEEAQVQRRRIIVTLPATEDGMSAARELVRLHDIQTHLSLVSCPAHASACIEAGAEMISMSAATIIQWLERRGGSQVAHGGHPGIQAMQSCATFMHLHKINTTLLVTEVRKWSELKELSGVGAVALRKEQLDEIPMRRLTTWYPQPGDRSSATFSALQTEYPSYYLDSKRSFISYLPAESRSLVLAVWCNRLGEMVAHMETIERAVWCEIEKRIRLDAIPLERLYQRLPVPTEVQPIRRATSGRVTSGRSTSSQRPRTRSRSNSRRRNESRQSATMVEDVDYF